LLVVEHFVAPSAVHGLGVFSKHFVPKGALVWRVHPAIDREIHRTELNDLPLHVVQKIQTHAEYLPSRDVFRLGADGDYFMNHSDDPNLIDAGESMYAARDILAGDELFCDYRLVRVVAFEAEAQSTQSVMVASGSR
jgi:SET domain-containing protein